LLTRIAATVNASFGPLFLLWPCSDFEREQRAIPAVSACNTRASIQPCEFGAGHAF
jgi:hypothetical protein